MQIHDKWSKPLSFKNKKYVAEKTLPDIAPSPAVQEIDALMAKLSPRNQALIRAMCTSGLTRKTVGERFGMPEQTVKNALSVIYKLAGYGPQEHTADKGFKLHRLCYLLGRADGEGGVS